MGILIIRNPATRSEMAEMSTAFEALSPTNIRPRQDNRGLELQSPELRGRFETIVRRLLEVADGS
jgi:hypothetical protein